MREGLIQRAQLLDRLLADLYGPMEPFSRDASARTRLVQSRFPACVPWRLLPQDRWLHLYAADLVRSRTANSKC